MFLRLFKRKKIKVISPKKEEFSEILALVDALKLSAREKSIDRAKIIQKHLLLIAEINNVVTKILAQSEEAIFLISSYFLHNSFKFLNQQEEEALHFVTGPEKQEIKVLDHIVPFKLDVQTMVAARGDSAEVRRILIDMQELNYKLRGYFHIHPGLGAGATFPSVVDLKLQDLFERGGYKALGAIFSRDGFIRFHSSRNLKIEIYGEGVKKINENLYRLLKIG